MRMVMTLALGLAVVAGAASAGERKTIPVGEPLVTISTDRRDDVAVAVLKAATDQRAAMFSRVVLPQGHQLEISEKGDRYCDWLKGYLSVGVEFGACLLDRDQNGEFEAVISPGVSAEYKLKAPIPYEAKRTTIIQPARTPKRIVYFGGSAGEARFSYREFTADGFARPAFTEDLTIPLETFPVTVTLKGVKMTIYGQSAAGLDVETSDP